MFYAAGGAYDGYSGNEIGPFRAVEESTLAQLISPEARTDIFAWYTFWLLLRCSKLIRCLGTSLQVLLQLPVALLSVAGLCNISCLDLAGTSSAPIAPSSWLTHALVL